MKNTVTDEFEEIQSIRLFEERHFSKFYEKSEGLEKLLEVGAGGVGKAAQFISMIV